MSQTSFPVQGPSLLLEGRGSSSSTLSDLEAGFVMSMENDENLKPPSVPSFAPSSASVPVPPPHGLSSSIPHQVHWEGLVRKKGDWLPRWEERYLILEGATLTYYNSKEDARACVDMRGRMILSKVRSENYGKAHGFLIETVGHKCFHLCCSTELEKDTWVEMMQAAIDSGVLHRLSGASITNGSSVSCMQIDLREFYVAFRQLLVSHSNSSQFFPKISRDVVLSSNYAPTVPFWGEYHGLDGVLHFFSIVYETVLFDDFRVTDIAQASQGTTAVIAGRETMQNRHNGRKFTQQWQHTLQFSLDGRVKSITIAADPIAASAVFGTKATSNLSLPLAPPVGSNNEEYLSGIIYVQVYQGEQLNAVEDGQLFLGVRLALGSQAGLHPSSTLGDSEATTSTSCTDNNPIWNSQLQLNFPGASKGKPCFMFVEVWHLTDSHQIMGIAKVNLAPFLALAHASKNVIQSSTSELPSNAVPQWYTLLSPNGQKQVSGKVQLSIYLKFNQDEDQQMNNISNNNSNNSSPNRAELETDAETPNLRPAVPVARKQSSKQLESKDQKKQQNRDKQRTNHTFRIANIQFDIPERYQMIKAVGQGAYGCVIAASDTETGQALAIKNIPNAFNDLVDAKRILREIRLMKHLQHPNLVNLCDLIRPPSLNDFSDVYIVTDLMETDLHRVIHSNQSLSDEHIQFFLYQMVVAINYVHSANVLHRDLKPSNILVNSDCDLKLCDFGLARGVEGMEDSGLTEYVVTRWYRAPELLLSSQYGKPMDVWAIGCILAEMLGRRPLFPGHDYLHQLKIIMDVLGTPLEDSLEFITNPKAKRFILRQPKKPEVPLSSIYPRANSLCIDLLGKMLIFDPKNRITIQEILQHPYLSSVRDIQSETTCPSPFNFDFEDCELTKTKLQLLIFQDICEFHPEALEELENKGLKEYQQHYQQQQQLLIKDQQQTSKDCQQNAIQANKDLHKR